MSNASGKVALITGANKGIGFEIARQIGRAGAQVFLGARDPVAGEKAATDLTNEELIVRFVRIDITDRASIAGAAASIEMASGQLDILVNNAGINAPGDGRPSVADLDAVESVMRTNFLGALAVTQAMLPLLHRSASARIVNVSSGLGSLTRSSERGYAHADTKLIGYGASKAALNMLTVHLAWELRDTAIKVFSAEPGYTATHLNGFRGTQTIPEGAAAAVRLALSDDNAPSGTFAGNNGVVPW
jgi:NAD(P)-dependent dehydrogenase (short-subunit alcohol dehydrogenase family)